jgi:hypothetical protein
MYSDLRSSCRCVDHLFFCFRERTTGVGYPVIDAAVETALALYDAKKLVR